MNHFVSSVRPAAWRMPTLLLSLTGASVAFAQSPAPSGSSTNHVHSDEAVHLDRVVITASPLGRTLFELAAPVTVLADQDLSFRQQPTLGETLAQQPGITSTYFGPNASRPIIRGLDGDRIRILQNGVGMLDASGTSVDHAVSSDPLTIKSVEVVRGPASLLYGSSAVGGVVNVIDNRIPDVALSSPLTGAVEGRYGSADNLRSGGAVVEGGHKGWNYHLDGFLRETEDLRIPGFARSERLRLLDPQPTEAENRLPNSAGKSDGGAFGTSYVGEKGWIGASVSGFNNRYGTVAEPDVTIRLHQRRLDLAGEVTQPFEAIKSIRFKLGLSDYKHTEYEGQDVGTVFKNRGYDGRLEATHNPLGRFEGAFGFQSQLSDFSALGDEAFLPATETLVNSGFFFEELKFDKFRIEFGGRLDHQSIRSSDDPNFGPGQSRDFTTGSGSVGFVYTPTDAWSGALSVAYTQRAPNYQELFANGPHLATDAFEVGDPTLGREHSLGIDLTFRKRTGFVTGSIGGFYNRFQDFIALTPTGAVDPVDNLPIFAYGAIPAEFYGAEAEVLFHLVETKPRQLHLELRGDWLEASNRDTGEPLPRIAPLRFGGALIFRQGSFNARLEALRTDYQGRVAANELPTGGNTLLNLGLTYGFDTGKVGWELFVKGSNLLDEEIRTHSSFLKDIAPQAGIGATLGLRASF